MACKEQRNIFGVNNSLFFGERLGGGGGKYAPGKQEKVKMEKQQKRVRLRDRRAAGSFPSAQSYRNCTFAVKPPSR